jgi:hypothetical protein
MNYSFLYPAKGPSLVVPWSIQRRLALNRSQTRTRTSLPSATKPVQNNMQNQAMLIIITLAFILASGILLVILSCALDKYSKSYLATGYLYW